MSAKTALTLCSLLALAACQDAAFVVLAADGGVEPRDAGTSESSDAAPRDAGAESNDGGLADAGGSGCLAPADAPVVEIDTSGRYAPILRVRTDGLLQEFGLLDENFDGFGETIGKPILRRFSDEGPAFDSRAGTVAFSDLLGLELETRNEQLQGTGGIVTVQDYVVFEQPRTDWSAVRWTQRWIERESLIETTFQLPDAQRAVRSPSVFRQSAYLFDVGFTHRTLWEVSLVDGSSTSVPLSDLGPSDRANVASYRMFGSSEAPSEIDPFLAFAVHDGPSESVVEVFTVNADPPFRYETEPCVLLSHDEIVTTAYVAVLTDCHNATKLHIWDRHARHGPEVVVTSSGPAQVPSALSFTSRDFVTAVWPEGEPAPLVRFHDKDGTPRSEPMPLSSPERGWEAKGLDVEVAQFGRQPVVGVAYASTHRDGTLLSGVTRFARFGVCLP